MGDASTRTLRISTVEVRPGDVVAGKYRIARRLSMLSAVMERMDEARPAPAGDADALVDLAGLHAMLGEAGPAVRLLSAVLEKGLTNPFFPIIMPEFLLIRKSPESRALFKLGN
jgi:hypothetical protein